MCWRKLLQVGTRSAAVGTKFRVRVTDVTIDGRQELGRHYHRSHTHSWCRCVVCSTAALLLHTLPLSVSPNSHPQASALPALEAYTGCAAHTRLGTDTTPARKQRQGDAPAESERSTQTRLFVVRDVEEAYLVQINHFGQSSFDGLSPLHGRLEIVRCPQRLRLCWRYCHVGVFVKVAAMCHYFCDGCLAALRLGQVH